MRMRIGVVYLLLFFDSCFAFGYERMRGLFCGDGYRYRYAGLMHVWFWMLGFALLVVLLAVFWVGFAVGWLGGCVLVIVIIVVVVVILLVLSEYCYCYCYCYCCC